MPLPHWSDVRSSLSGSIMAPPLSAPRPPWHGEERSAPGVLDWRWVVTSYIDAYRPRRATPAWDRVAGEVRRIVHTSLPQTPYTAGQLLGPLTQLALFADGHGHPAEAAAWLSREVIEHFIATSAPILAQSTLANYRARLLRLREAVLGPETKTGRPAHLSGSLASRPYTPAERAELWAWANGQNTAALRQGIKTLMALGFGCGLDSPEIVPLRAHDVRTTTADGPVVLHVRGRRDRLVVCRRPWERILAEAATSLPAGSWLFRPDAHARAKNTVVNFLARATASLTAPPLVMGRARASWIVELVDANVPLTALVAASGVDSLHALSRLMPHFTVLSAQQAATALRGAT